MRLRIAKILVVACTAIAVVASAADAGVATLLRDLRDPDAKVREKAVRGIGELGLGERAAEPLLEALNDPVGDVRAAAAGALGRMGVDARDAVPALVRLLRDPEQRARAFRGGGACGNRNRDAGGGACLG